MRSIVVSALGFLLSYSAAFGFDGIVNYRQDDSVKGKKVESITRKISVFIAENKVRRVTIEFDPTRYKTSMTDTFINYDSNTFTVIDKTAKSYTQGPINLNAKMPGELVELATGPVVAGNPTTNYTFKRDYPGARRIVVSYSNKLKITPVQYLHDILGSQAWGINPNTGAIAMRFFMQLDGDTVRIIETSDIAERKLNPSELTPNLNGLIKK